MYVSHALIVNNDGFYPHSRASIGATNITCTTVEFTASAPPMGGTVMVMIDSATVSNISVQYSYTLNPEFHSVTPMNTILGYMQNLPVTIGQV